jgi:hypothetical protein
MSKKYYLGVALVALLITTVGVSALVSASEGDFQRGEMRGEKFSPEKMEEMKANKEAMKAVVESGDYEAWKALVEESGRDKILETITADNFAQFVEMHNLKQADDREGARAIADELGLKKIGKKKGGDLKAFKAGYEKGLAECEIQ